jgi:hypothetical protein
MPRQISIRADLKAEELERRYRQAHEPVARSPWQSVWLLAQGQTREEVEEATGSSLTWIRTIARRYHVAGEQRIGDRHHANRGGPRLLSRERAGPSWIRRSRGAAPDGGLWTGATVASWSEERIGRVVAEATGVRSLPRLHRRPPRPRRRQVTADHAAHASVKGGDSVSR